MARMPGNLRPSDMFQINLLQRLGAQKQRKSPTLFSALADALSTAGGAYMQKSIYGDARDREESANKRVLSMLTGTPAVMGTTQRLRSEEEASAAGDLVADDGLGLPMQQAPQEPSKYGVKSAFDLDTIPRDPYSENVGVPMPSLIEMVSKVKTPAVSATTQQLISAMMDRDASPEMRQIAASRYAASVKPETFNLQFAPNGAPFVTSSKTGIKQLPGNFAKLTSEEARTNMLIESGIPPKEARKLAVLGRPPQAPVDRGTTTVMSGKALSMLQKKLYGESSIGLADMDTNWRVTRDKKGNILTATPGRPNITDVGVNRAAVAGLGASDSNLPQATSGETSTDGPPKTDAPAATGLPNVVQRWFGTALEKVGLSDEETRPEAERTVNMLRFVTQSMRVLDREGKDSVWASKKVLQALPDISAGQSPADYRSKATKLIRLLDKEIDRLSRASVSQVTDQETRNGAKSSLKRVSDLRNSWASTLPAVTKGDFTVEEITPKAEGG